MSTNPNQSLSGRGERIEKRCANRQGKPPAVWSYPVAGTHRIDDADDDTGARSEQSKRLCHEAHPTASGLYDSTNGSYRHRARKEERHPNILRVKVGVATGHPRRERTR